MACSKLLRGYVVSGQVILFALATCILILVPSTAQAQADVQVEKHLGLGTGVYFPGYYNFQSERLHGLAFGWELLFPSGFGISGEVGLDAVYELSPTASLNATRHFFHRRKARLDPFVQAGFAFVPGFYADWGFGVNARVGGTYWAAQRIGLRIEYVENLHAYLDENSRLVVFGITFR
jgi:hypothetical protein